jgi:hypothetical protein
MRLCSRYLLPIWVAMLLVSCGEANKVISNQDEEVPPKEDTSQSDFPEHDFDDSSSSTGDVPNDEEDQSTAPSVLEGQVFSEVGTPLSGIRIIACNADSCTDCATDDNGSYILANLINGPWKMEAVDDSGLYMDLLFHQRAEDPLPIIQLPYADQNGLQWSAEEGGTLSMFNGGLQLTADPGSLSYPGEEVELKVSIIPVDKLPPYATTPWEGKEDQTLGVILNPTHLVSLTPVGVRLSVSWQVSEEMDYDIYTVDLATGMLQASGRAHMQPSGELWSAPDSTIFEPATMIFVPATSENED